MNLALKLISSPWFWADLVLSISGGVVVYWGLLIEKRAEKRMPPDDFKPDLFDDAIKSVKAELERGWRILMFGIMMEVIAALGISVISGLEIAVLTDKSEQAQKDAADSRVLASSIETTNALLWQTNMVIKSNLDALELKLRPRRITMEQRTNFMVLAANIPKIPIRILIGPEGKDTEDLAMDVRDALTRAGFPTNADAGLFGIDRDPRIIFTRKLETTNSPDLLFISHASDNDPSPNYIKSLSRALPNGLLQPILVGTNNTDVHVALFHCFGQIGLECGLVGSSNIKPGEWLIFVTMK